MTHKMIKKVLMIYFSRDFMITGSNQTKEDNKWFNKIFSFFKL